MRDPRLIYHVTRQYAQSLGLRLLPLGIWLLVTALDRRGGDGATLFQQQDMLLLVPAMLATIFLAKFYEYRFGRVEPLSGSRLVSQPGIIIALLVIYLATPLLEAYWQTPVLLPTLLVALFFGAYWQAERGARLHFAVAGLLLAAFSLLPLAGGPVPAAFSAPQSGNLVLGISLIVLSVVDHWLIERAFAALGVDLS